MTTTSCHPELVSGSIFLYKLRMFIKDWWDIWIYLGAFLFVTMRPQTSSLIKGFFFKRKAKKTLEDKKILDFIFNKTGLKLKKITVIEDDRLLGMMGASTKKESTGNTGKENEKIEKKEREVFSLPILKKTCFYLM